MEVFFRTLKALLMEISRCRELGSDWEATRLEALRWIALLLDRHRTEVLLLLCIVVCIWCEMNFHYCS